MKKIVYISFILLTAMLSGCEDYLGKKTDLDFIDVPPDNSIRDIAYVPILPVLNDFSRPSDVCAGFDGLIYVVDEGSQEVIAMDESGRILGRKFIPGARSLIQDRRFDLLVIGTSDSTMNVGGQDTTLTFSTIYRLRLAGGGAYDITSAQIVNKVVHPFYYTQSNPVRRTNDFVRFNNIGVIGNNQDPNRNNQYYVSRQYVRSPDPDPSNPEVSSGPLGPNDAVLYFSNEDELISPIRVQTSSGLLFDDFFEHPSGITTLTQPPQFGAASSSDFIYTSLEPSNALKVQYIEFVESEFGASYRPRILASSDTSQADGFINSPNKFKQPEDITLAGDGSQFLFVVDSESDSLYQFSFTGFEGVKPPAAAGIDRYIKASFGGTGTDLMQFNDPVAVAYYNQIVYVADAGNGRVMRYKLTLDFD